MAVVLSEDEKRLVLSAKKKGFKGLSPQEKDAVLKYKKILAQNKQKSAKPKESKEKPKEHKESFTIEDKRLLMSAKKKGMKGLTPEEKKAVLKYKKLLQEQKSYTKSAKAEAKSTKTHKIKDTSSEKLPVIKEQIPDNQAVKKEHFSKFKGKKIMIVEDNLINRKMLDAILKGTGIDVVFAENGKIALQYLSKGMKFDLVLMDIEMPELDGLSATKKIRKSKHFASLPIVALTSSTKKEDIVKILKSGMNGYIFKPVALGRLYNAFRLFMARR